MGNPWVDPSNQLSNFGLHAHSLGLIDTPTREHVEQLQLKAVFGIEEKQYKVSYDAYREILSSVTNGAGGCMPYDYREYTSFDVSAMEGFLNLEATKT